MDTEHEKSFDIFLQQLGITLRRTRKEKNLSQMDLHYKSDVSRDWISDIEQGRKNPSIHILYKLATALDIEIQILFTPWDNG